MEGYVMGSIRLRKDNGNLFFDFHYLGKRCREQTALKDTKANRKLTEAALAKIEIDIASGQFDYSKYFPNSKNLHLAIQNLFHAVPAMNTNSEFRGIVNETTQTPLLEVFANTWFDEMKISWRRTYIKTIRITLDKYLIVQFGDRMVHSILREDLLAYRSSLGKALGRNGQTLSSRRINAIMLAIRQILNEAADRFHFNTPTQRIKPLKVRKVDIAPFTLDEVQLIINRVRVDYRQYLIVRFFTGMRTGEVDGLKWKYIDFERRQILVRETFTAGEMEDDTKTEQSKREIHIAEVVYQALKIQFEATASLSEFVFCNSEGNPLNLNNFTNRVWAPLLRHLKIAYRKPYMMRHTAATLWLAAGENPEWIARQLGHSSTEMLFRVYSRYVPNMTRQDGSAFERMLASKLQSPQATIAPSTLPQEHTNTTL
jgi:integrase